MTRPRESNMRGIFLDFDGVTHPVSSIADWRSLNLHGGDLPHLIQKRSLFRWLPLLEKSLDEHPDVVLVVHSAWRSVANNSSLRDILGALSDRFIGVTSLEMGRYDGILDLAQRSGMDQYLIIDDATHEFPVDCEQLLAPDPETGLSDGKIGQKLRDWLDSTAPQSAPVPCMSR